MSEDKEYSVTKLVPQNGEKVLCYGYQTFCCNEDKEKKLEWHEATFKICTSEYKLKKEIPEDLEESIFEYYKVIELWETKQGHVIGVTKWKYKDKE